MAVYYIELVDTSGYRHWSDVISSDGEPCEALQNAAAFCDCAEEGMIFNAYPIDLTKPIGSMAYDSEVVY
jgi:hypothetical protein